MSKLSKRAISTLVITIFLLSTITIAYSQPPPFGIDGLWETDDVGFTIKEDGVKGDSVAVTGVGVTSGAVVNLYWDYVTAGYKMNATEAEPAGTFEIWFKVPEAVNGDHYIWAKDTETGETTMFPTAFFVDPMVTISPSSGLPGDPITVKGYGFNDEVVIDIKIEPWTVPTETIGTGDGSTSTFSGTLTHRPLVSGTLVITAGTQTLTDDSSGGFTGDGSGTINYNTGVYIVTFTVPAAVGSITADYTRSGFTIEDSSTFETTELGSFTKDFNIPSYSYGDYDITATEVVSALWATDQLTIGASVSLDPEEGPSGKIVTITGEGWTYTEEIIVTIVAPATPVRTLDDDIITVVSGGKFSAKIVIPSLDEGEYTINVVETGGVKGPATVTFEVTGETDIELVPGFAPPGGSVVIKGFNFTQSSGTEVTLKLYEKAPGTKIETIDTIETDSKGEFTETIRVPAVDYGTWELVAVDEYGLTTQKDFRIGIMIVIISPSYGPTGTPVYLTGIGFTDGGTWNATMDGVAITDEAVNIPPGTESISATIYIPTVPEDTYTITVRDIDTEIEVSGTFIVTATTEVSMDPAQAPNGYNATITGLNFAGKINVLDFVLYNATLEWDMNVLQTIGSTDYPAVTDIDGEFTAWWEVPDDETLSIGSYTVNVTDGDDLFAQTSFNVVEERIYIKPLKDKFDIGDTVSFEIKNDFDYHNSYMVIRDPDNSLYWKTKPFVEDIDWLKDADLYTVPYYGQTSGGNPMTLSSDAPLGEWFWAFYTSDDDQLATGTFEVGPSVEAVLAEKIDALSEELGIDIDTLRVYIDDLGIDLDDTVSSMAEQIATAVSGMEADIAGLSDDLDDAVTGMQDDIDDMGTKMDSIETMVDDISETSTAAQDAANTAAASADAATEAAEATQQQTSGLTGLVYGAIGASLIAALAAIVSLMQISRRIAG